MQYVENISEYLLMESIPHPCMEDCEHEDSEVEFSHEEEDDYPSFFNENNDHLEEEENIDKNFDVFYDESQPISHYLTKDEIIEKKFLPDHLLTQNTQVGGNLDGDSREDIIEGF